MAKKKEEKTNVMRLLDREKIAYLPHAYDHADGVIDGAGVARKLGQDPARVFKTLVTRGASGNYAVFCLPVEKELDLKKVAKASKDKKVEMIHMKELLPLTGYMRGGCSPIGMKKKFPTYIEETAQIFDKISISAGQRGVQVILNPEELAKYVDAQFVALI